MQYFLLETQPHRQLRSTNGRITGSGPGRWCGLECFRRPRRKDLSPWRLERINTIRATGVTPA